MSYLLTVIKQKMATQPGPESAEPQSQLWNQTGVAAGGEPRQITMPVLTEEERLVLKECDSDGFYKSALPMSLGSMLAAHMMVKRNYWIPNPKYGSLPKVITLGAIGYFFGKVAYLPVCQQKILQKIPNSNLAIQIRKAKGMPEQDAFVASSDSAAAGGLSSTKMKDDYSAPDGLDDRFRPTIDRDVKEPEEPSQDKSSLTYEELRRRNRQEYNDQISKAPSQAPGSNKDIPRKPFVDAKSGDAESSLESSSTLPSQAPTSRRRTNIWGDPIDD